MKKIKVFHWFLVILLVLFTIGFLTNIYLFQSFPSEIRTGLLITSFFSLLIILAAFFLQRALYRIIKNGFFSTIVSKQFNISGLFFLLSGLGDFIFNIVKKSKDLDAVSQLYFFPNLATDFLLIMIGFGLFILAEFVENGNVIQQENDLTI